jgi:2-iminoacetate synthase
VTFREHFATLPIAALRDAAERATDADVDRALATERPDLRDFAALVSIAASHRLEEIARRSAEITTRRFGRTVQLYAPLYLSNECVETCTYCSFSRGNPIVRRTLTVDEIVAEAELLRRRGFRHLLLVSGEHPRHVSPQHVVEVLRALRPRFPSLSVEVQPQPVEVYRRWVEAGCDGLVVYQETYDRSAYASVHLAGKKKDFDWRLGTPERGAEAGMRRLGIGALLGLSDWRFEGLCLAAHAAYLSRLAWRAAVTVSLPRLRPAEFADTRPRAPVSDRELVQLVGALRLLLPDAGIVLSTRESAALRDGMLHVGVTQISAGSRTEPGGYSHPDESGRQFEIEDPRSSAEVADAIRKAGLDPVWKDWETVLHA